MKTLKGNEIAKKFGVSPSTVNGWISDAERGKNSLEIFNRKILDNAKNQEELGRLYKFGRKSKHSEFKKEFLVSKEFLKMFDKDQIIEFVSDLSNKEINEKFSYLNREGAKNWNLIYESEASNLQSNSYFLLKSLFGWIKPYLVKDVKYNLFDVGPGNGLPILDFLKPFVSDQKLEKYYSLDISKDINEITKKNIEASLPNVFGGSLVTDIENLTFSSYLYEKLENKISNLIFFIGGTISNVADRVRVFKNIQAGMAKNDLFVFTFSLDTPENRIGVSYVLNKESNLHQNWLPKFLGLEIDPAKNRADYNPDGNFKYKTFKVEKDYTLIFPIFNQNKEVFLAKGQEVITWKHFLVSYKEVEEELLKAGLQTVFFAKDLTGQTGMIICKSK